MACMRLVVGGDHAGFCLKGPIVDALRAWGHTVNGIGTHTPEPVDARTSRARAP
jgi:ribose 5-phosphate isomerase B